MPIYNNTNAAFTDLYRVFSDSVDAVEAFQNKHAIDGSETVVIQAFSHYAWMRRIYDKFAAGKYDLETSDFIKTCLPKAMVHAQQYLDKIKINLEENSKITFEVLFNAMLNHLSAVDDRLKLLREEHLESTLRTTFAAVGYCLTVDGPDNIGPCFQVTIGRLGNEPIDFAESGVAIQDAGSWSRAEENASTQNNDSQYGHISFGIILVPKTGIINAHQWLLNHPRVCTINNLETAAGKSATPAKIAQPQQRQSKVDSVPRPPLSYAQQMEQAIKRCADSGLTLSNDQQNYLLAKAAIADQIPSFATMHLLRWKTNNQYEISKVKALLKALNNSENNDSKLEQLRAAACINTGIFSICGNGGWATTGRSVFKFIT